MGGDRRGSARRLYRWYLLVPAQTESDGARAKGEQARRVFRIATSRFESSVATRIGLDCELVAQKSTS